MSRLFSENEYPNINRVSVKEETIPVCFMCEICNCRLRSVNRSDLNYHVRYSIMFSEKIFYDALVKEKVYSTCVHAVIGNINTQTGRVSSAALEQKYGEVFLT